MFGNVVDTMVVMEGKEEGGGDRRAVKLKGRMLESTKFAVKRVGGGTSAVFGYGGLSVVGDGIGWLPALPWASVQCFNYKSSAPELLGRERLDRFISCNWYRSFISNIA